MDVCILGMPTWDLCIGQTRPECVIVYIGHTKWGGVYWTNQVVICVLDTPIEVVCIGSGGDV